MGEQNGAISMNLKGNVRKNQEVMGTSELVGIRTQDQKKISFRH